MLKIHFLNVGHGDCVIVEFPSGRTTMVDINNASELEYDTIEEIFESNAINESVFQNEMYKYKFGLISFGQLMEAAGYTIKLTNPIEYFENNIEKSNIFRFISTHPHMDHITGLSLLKDNITNVWLTKNDYSQDEEKLTDLQKEDWKFYKKLRNNIGSRIDEITVLSPQAGSEADFYKDDGIYILAPNHDLKKLSDEKNNANILSTVIVIKYAGHKIVLGGDAEADTWEYILTNYEELISNVTILKASHHGRNSGYHMEGVKLMNPQFTIVSVGKKPKQDASNKYRNYSNNVFSTRWKGNIVFTLNTDGTGNYSTEYDR